MAVQAKEIDLGNGLLVDLRELMGRARGLLKKAEEAGDLRTALIGVREIARLIELRGRATGELNDKDLGKQIVPMFMLPPGSHVNVTLNQVRVQSGPSTEITTMEQG